MRSTLVLHPRRAIAPARTEAARSSHSRPKRATAPGSTPRRRRPGEPERRSARPPAAIRRRSRRTGRPRTTLERAHSRSLRNATEPRRPHTVRTDRAALRAKRTREIRSGRRRRATRRAPRTLPIRRRRTHGDRTASGSDGNARTTSSRFLRRSTVPGTRIVRPSPAPRSRLQPRNRDRRSGELQRRQRAGPDSASGDTEHGRNPDGSEVRFVG